MGMRRERFGNSVCKISYFFPLMCTIQTFTCLNFTLYMIEIYLCSGFLPYQHNSINTQSKRYLKHEHIVFRFYKDEQKRQNLPSGEKIKFTSFLVKIILCLPDYNRLEEQCNYGQQTNIHTCTLQTK